MWPFKRKNPEPEVGKSQTVKSIICIPGTWTDKIEILGNSNGELMIAGNFLIDNSNDQYYEVELCLPDERMKQSFTIAGSVNRVSTEFLDKIGQHQSVLYLIGETGDINKAIELARIADKLLKVGGIGVKVESTGKAFEPSHWNKNLEFDIERAAYDYFVLDSLLTHTGDICSCGMHNLGLKDTIVSGLEVQEAIDLIAIFSLYQLIDKPSILSGQTFQTAIDSPFYRITEESNQPNKGIELFENPFGMWRLTRI